MSLKNRYSVQQEGLKFVDKTLAGFSCAVLPSSLVLLSLQHESIDHLVKLLLIITVSLSGLNLFLFLWHIVRWEVRRVYVMEKVEAATKHLADDMVHILETVAIPNGRRSQEGERGENIVVGPDGKEYIRGSREEIIGKYTTAISEAMSPSSPIMSNTISAHSRKIFEVQKNAHSNPMPESKA